MLYISFIFTFSSATSVRSRSAGLVPGPGWVISRGQVGQHLTNPAPTRQTMMASKTIQYIKKYIAFISPEKNSIYFGDMGKRHRSLSVTSEKSQSSLSDHVVQAGRKAKQVALKTVRSLTALIKPRRHRVISDSEGKFFFLFRI